MKPSTIWADKLKKLTGVFFWLAIWQFAAMKIGKEVLLASPVSTIKARISLCGQSGFWSAIIFSLTRIMLGFALALVTGVLLAGLSAVYDAVRYIFAPLFNVIKAVPVASFIILALLWVRGGNLSICISFLMVLPIIYNNMLRKNSILDVKMYARRLYNLDRAIDINCNAQKTPALIVCDQEQRLTMMNLYKEYDGNAPVIFGDKAIDLSALKVLKTDAPMVADKLFELKNMTWNEALTRIGISNASYQKKERLVSDEVARSQGGTIASRYSRLEMRRQAVDKINEMFGHNIEVNYREDYREIDYDKMITGESEGKEEMPIKQLYYRAEGDNG